MANISEPAKGSSILRAKGADRPVQRGTVAGACSLTSRLVVVRHPVYSWCLRLRAPKAELENLVSPSNQARSPIFPPQQKSQDRSDTNELVDKPTVRKASGGAGVGGWKKRMPFCNETDTGSEFARRESEQTSAMVFLCKRTWRTDHKEKWRWVTRRNSRSAQLRTA